MDEKDTLHRYLRARRGELLAKLDGLGEYDARRPITMTGTNLLGLVKHVASVQLGYLGEVFGRPAERVLPWFEPGAQQDDDMWANAGETRAEILDLYGFSAAHADATVEALPLDALGEVPWWPPERRTVTLHQILVHLSVEVARHAGHADILRELIDGTVGTRPGDTSLAQRSPEQWQQFRERIEHAARLASGSVEG